MSFCVVCGERPRVNPRETCSEVTCRYRAEPEYRERRKASASKKYHSDPEYRERVKARERERWATSPTLRERQRARQRERRLVLNARQNARRTDPQIKEQRRAIERERRATEGERIRARERERWASDPEYRAKRKARVQQRKHTLRTAGPWDSINILGLLQRYGDECYLCLKPVDPNAPFSADNKAEIEHIHPASRGGTHTWDNVLPACHSCNTMKRAQTLDELFASPRAVGPHPIDPLKGVTNDVTRLRRSDV